MEGEGVGAGHQAAITQLSHAGALVESAALLLPGTKVILGFCLSEMLSPLTIRGTVLNNTRIAPLSGTTRPATAGPPGVEIQFIDLPPADQSRIKAWVLTSLPRPFGSS
jgi:hypothetical protein